MKALILKKSRIAIFLGSLFLITSCESLDDVLTVPGLTDSEIVEGLVAALDVGLGNSVNSASGLDGYLGNELIKILLPDEVVSLQSQIDNSAVLSAGYAAYIGLFNNGNDLFGDLVTAMNRGAEQAATTAGPIFGDALTNLTFQDARNILEGSNQMAATEFFERETRTSLITAFSPNVSQALDQTEANTIYGTVVGFLNYQIDPIFGTTAADLLNTDPNLPPTLEEYATGKAVDGLFTLVGQEEEKIRDNPFIWGNNIIEKVFGSLFQVN